jgi:hypothetical protein
MYAFQLPQPNPNQTKRPRRAPRSSRLKRQSPYFAIAVETSVKLAINVLISVVAIVALVKLLPYKSDQESKLKELDVAVKTTGDRVSRVQANFKQYFDPSQTRALMQHSTNRIDPSQRQIVILQPSAKGEPGR